MYLKLSFISFMLMGAINTSVLAATHEAAGAGAGALSQESVVNPLHVAGAGVGARARINPMEDSYEVYGLRTAAAAFETELRSLEDTHLEDGGNEGIRAFKQFLGAWKAYCIRNEALLPDHYGRIRKMRGEVESARQPGTDGAFLDIQFPSAGSASIVPFRQALGEWILANPNPFGLFLYGIMTYDGIGYVIPGGIESLVPYRIRGIQIIEQAKEKHLIPAIEFIIWHLRAELAHARAPDSTEYKENLKQYKKLNNSAEYYLSIMQQRPFQQKADRAAKIHDRNLWVVYPEERRNTLFEFYSLLQEAILEKAQSLRPHPKSSEITTNFFTAGVSFATSAWQAYNGTGASALPALGTSIATCAMGISKYREGKGTLWFVECCRRSKCCPKSASTVLSALPEDVFKDKVDELALHQTLKLAPTLTETNIHITANRLATVIAEAMKEFLDGEVSSLSVFLANHPAIKNR